MICGDGEDASVGQSFDQGLLVVGSLDGRVAFDAGAQSLVVLVREEQVCRHGLGGDVGIAMGGNHLQFAGGGDMGHVESCSCLGGQLEGQGGGPNTGLLASDLGMVLHGRILAIALLGQSHVLADECGVLAVAHDGNVELGSQLEYLFQCLATVHEHVARR